MTKRYTPEALASAAVWLFGWTTLALTVVALMATVGILVRASL